MHHLPLALKVLEAKICSRVKHKQVECMVLVFELPLQLPAVKRSTTKLQWPHSPGSVLPFAFLYQLSWQLLVVFCLSIAAAAVQLGLLVPVPVQAPGAVKLLAYAMYTS